MTTVLVIGAAGKTGRAVTAALTSRGVDVRAAVRSARRAETAYAVGARSISVVDLETGSGLDEAVADADAIYHLAPNVHPDEVGIADRIACAAARAGLSRFVFHSVLHPDDASMPHHVRKAAAEKVVRTHLPGATVLRPAAYHQNLVDAALAGRISVPYSLDSPFTNVDLVDVAEVAATVLTRPGHEGVTYDLAGPEVLSVRDQAHVASDVLGRPVEAVRVEIADWVAGPGASLTAQARDDLLAMFASYDRGGLVGDSSTLRRLLGHEPSTWAQALEPA
ncbi:SDR family oxidoreductase [Terrabacter sp. C0L_2]|uniref:SDR family oxidoreductase n=1 Tax=Terrabacter sp. C0L_2 TaxID=3108389 RepID=UPI002ECFC545|nr:NmrA family NAD(P)-binding protein [Terrabacter sp. C0L_2]